MEMSDDWHPWGAPLCGSTGWLPTRSVGERTAIGLK
jgi:hypothetical protein